MSAADVPGLLLVNLGTPQAPDVRSVRRYLREFLSDPLVLDMAAPLRWLLLYGVILPLRPRRSAEAYAKIWTAEGSPLLVNSRALAEKLRQRLGGIAVVGLAMRYGEPSVAAALAEMRTAGVRRIVVFPLFPEYSVAATGSAVARVSAEASRGGDAPALHVVPAFYGHPLYVKALAANAAPHVREVDPEVVFFSFHGLPERQVRKSDTTGRWCFASPDCCERVAAAEPAVLAGCYRAQCFTTARLLGDALGIPQEKRIVCFQSRLGRERWLGPATAESVRAAAERGVKRAVIVAPSFVADCLETLEELGLRAAADFRAHGGEELRVVPALNAGDEWVEAVVAIARGSSS